MSLTTSTLEMAYSLYSNKANLRKSHRQSLTSKIGVWSVRSLFRPQIVQWLGMISSTAISAAVTFGFYSMTGLGTWLLLTPSPTSHSWWMGHCTIQGYPQPLVMLDKQCSATNCSFIPLGWKRKKIIGQGLNATICPKILFLSRSVHIQNRFLVLRIYRASWPYTLTVSCNTFTKWHFYIFLSYPFSICTIF